MGRLRKILGAQTVFGCLAGCGFATINTIIGLVVCPLFVLGFESGLEEALKPYLGATSLSLVLSSALFSLVASTLETMVYASKAVRLQPSGSYYNKTKKTTRKGKIAK